MQTVKEQLKGVRKGTKFVGWGAYTGRTVELVDRNLNGHAHFRPLGLNDNLFLSHVNTQQLHRA